MRTTARQTRMRRWIAASVVGALAGALLAAAPAVVPAAPLSSASALDGVCDPASPEFDRVYLVDFGALAPHACAIQEAALQRLIEETWSAPYTLETRRTALVHHRGEVAAAIWIELLARWQEGSDNSEWQFAAFRDAAIRPIVRPIAQAGLNELNAWRAQGCDYNAPLGATFDPCPVGQPTHIVAMWPDNDPTKIASPTRDELLAWGSAVAIDQGAVVLGDAHTRQEMHSALRALRHHVADLAANDSSPIGDDRLARLDAMAAAVGSTTMFATDTERPAVRADRVRTVIGDTMVTLGNEFGALVDQSVSRTLSDLTGTLSIRISGPGGAPGPSSLSSFASWVWTDSIHLTFSTFAFLLKAVNWTSQLTAPDPAGSAQWFTVTAGSDTYATQDLPLRIGADGSRVTVRLLADGTWVTAYAVGEPSFGRELVYTAPAGDLKSLAEIPGGYRLLDLRGFQPGAPDCSQSPGCVTSPFFLARSWIPDDLAAVVTVRIEPLVAPMTVQLVDALPGSVDLGTVATSSALAVASYETELQYGWEITRAGRLVDLIETADGSFGFGFSLPGTYDVTLRVSTSRGEVSDPIVQTIVVPTPDDWSAETYNGLVITVHPVNWDGGATVPEEIGPWDEYGAQGSVCLHTGLTELTDYSVGYGGVLGMFGSPVVDQQSDRGFACFNRSPGANLAAGSYRFAARTWTTGSCEGLFGPVSVRQTVLGTSLVPTIACTVVDLESERFTLEVSDQDPTLPNVVTRWGGASEQDLSADTGVVVGEIGNEVVLAIARSGGVAERLTYEIAWADGSVDALVNVGCTNGVDRCTISHTFDVPVSGLGATVVAVDRFGSRSPVASQYFTVRAGDPQILDRQTDVSENNLVTLTGLLDAPAGLATRIAIDWQDGTAAEEFGLPLPGGTDGRFRLSHHYAAGGMFAPQIEVFAGSDSLGVVAWDSFGTTNFAPEVLVQHLIVTGDGPWEVGTSILPIDRNPADEVRVCIEWGDDPAIDDGVCDVGIDDVTVAVGATSGTVLAPTHAYSTAGIYEVRFIPLDLVGGDPSTSTQGAAVLRQVAVGLALTPEEEAALLPQVTGDTPVIVGVPAVGSPLVAQIGSWQPDFLAEYPLQFAYTWLRDGVPIPGYANVLEGDQYTVRSADQGAELTVQVRGFNAVTRELTLTSDPVEIAVVTTWLALEVVVASDRVATLTGAFDDPSELVTSASVDWGDGTVEPLDDLDGALELTHVYGGPGEYEVVVTLANEVGGTFPESAVAVVPRVPAEWTTVTATPVEDALRIDVQGMFVDDESWVTALTIDWGDGHESPVADLDGEFVIDWTYALPGTYTVTATLSGEPGAPRIHTVDVTVVGPPLPDLDGDGIPDETDPDIDGDGVINERDLDPWDPTVRDIVPLTEDEVRALDAGHVTGPATAHPGEEIRLGVSGAEPGTTFVAFLHSEPVSLGSFEVGPSGTTVLIPVDTDIGPHLIAVYETSGVFVGWLAIAIAPLDTDTPTDPETDPGPGADGAEGGAGSGLATTGRDTRAIMLLALVLLVLGGTASFAAARFAAARTR